MNPSHPTPVQPRYEPSGAGLTQALADLGNTPDQVADTLRRGNHHGAVCSEATCPLTAYLTVAFPAASHIRVTSTQALFRHRGGTVRAWLPRPVRHLRVLAQQQHLGGAVRDAGVPEDNSRQDAITAVRAPLLARTGGW